MLNLESVLGGMSFFDFASFAPDVYIAHYNGMDDFIDPIGTSVVVVKDRRWARVICFLLDGLPEVTKSAIVNVMPSDGCLVVP